MAEQKQPSHRDERDNKGPSKGPPRHPQLFFWVVTVLGMVLLFMFLSGRMGGGESPKDYEKLLQDIEEGKVDEVIAFKEALAPTKIRIRYKEEGREPVEFFAPTDKYEERLYSVTRSAKEKGIQVNYRTAEPEFSFKDLVPYLPAIILLVFFFVIISRMFRAQGGSGGLFSFGKSRARLVNKETSKVTFAHVAGINEAKEEVSEIIEFLKNPGKFQRLGGRVPRGVVLEGPAGTGKTLLAKAIAGEANVPFFSISGSDFVEMFVGVGASRVRDLFKQARASAPCIIFLDEIDAVGRKRGAGLGGGHDEREQTLNAILVEMDGFESDEGIIMIASTNRPDVLDPALLRRGRFDREILIDLPDVKGREEILKVHTKDVKTGPDVDLSRVARGTPAFSGADLEALVNEAAIQAAMRGQEHVTMDDMEEARDKIRWGRQKKSLAIMDEEKKVTAYHEAGHAIAAYLLPEVEPLHKVTIIPRRMALGATMQLPKHDRYHMQKRRLLGDVCVSYGGRVAEQLFCEDITSGAREDIRRATKILRLIVCELGMSERLGPIAFKDEEEHLFLGREIAKDREHSEKLSEEIDNEVRKLADECYQRALNLVKENGEAVQRIAQVLLKKEILSAQEVADIVAEVRGKQETVQSTA